LDLGHFENLKAPLFNSGVSYKKRNLFLVIINLILNILCKAKRSAALWVVFLCLVTSVSCAPTHQTILTPSGVSPPPLCAKKAAHVTPTAAFCFVEQLGLVLRSSRLQLLATQLLLLLRMPHAKRADPPWGRCRAICHCHVVRKHHSHASSYQSLTSCFRVVAFLLPTPAARTSHILDIYFSRFRDAPSNRRVGGQQPAVHEPLEGA
jgi:hypothetical protein